MAEVRLSVDLAHPRARVWRALTEPTLLGEWLMPTDQPGDWVARPGSTFTLQPGTLPGFLGPVRGELIEAVPGERLVMRWQGENLHTRMSWQVTELPGGCRLELVQTGFIGAPAGLRRRALRASYTELFGDRLPSLLAGLAAAEAAEPGQGSAEPPPPDRVAVAGTRDVPSLTEPAIAGGPHRRLRPAAPGALPRPRSINQAAAWWAGRPARLARPTDRPELGKRDVSQVRSWARATGGALAAAGFAAVVLAAMSAGGPAGGPGSDRAGPPGPDMAVQPRDDGAGPESPTRSSNDRTVPTEPAPSPAPAGPTGSAGATGAPTGPAAPPPPTGTPERTAPDGRAGPELTARLESSGLRLVGLNLLGLTTTVTIANPGPGHADGWQVVVDVDGQQVINVTGAEATPAGSSVILTPVRDDGLAVGAEASFRFDIPGLVPRPPAGCTIDGLPCD